MTEKTCPRCGFVAPVHAKRCPKCGLEPRRDVGGRKPYVEAAILGIVGLVLCFFGVPKLLSGSFDMRTGLVLVLAGGFFVVWAYNLARDAPM